MTTFDWKDSKPFRTLRAHEAPPPQPLLEALGREGGGVTGRKLLESQACPTNGGTDRGRPGLPQPTLAQRKLSGNTPPAARSSEGRAVSEG